MTQDNKDTSAIERLDEAMASAWRELSNQYRKAREMQRLLWNRTNSLNILNSFLVLHGKLTQNHYGKYAHIEKAQVAEAAARFQNGQPLLSGEFPSNVSASPEPQRDGACWKLVLAGYCCIHGRLKVELRSWNEDDYREFESTIASLIQYATVPDPSSRNRDFVP
jgi:hypothetical protein